MQPRRGQSRAAFRPAAAKSLYPLNQHLTETSRKVIENAQAVLIVDQAGWHISNNLVVPANITIPPLQPRSPELNPVENI